ncbi:MAG: arginine--tRNA ligase [Oscillospiraceae bacterium]|nr:arginine--tRNA ligase [Oscillospiraceae bacterium]
MRDPVALAKSGAKESILKACAAARQKGLLPDAPIPDFTVEIPADTSHGDFAANVALVGARAFSMPPRRIAEIICGELSLGGTVFARAEVAGPGFLNLFLGEEYYAGVVAGVLEEKEQYGRTGTGAHRKYMVEFVSANPTGPMHLGNARGGALGDCLASVLDAAGYDVTREFYVNDAGNQIEKFGSSLSARYLELYHQDVEFPEDGYHGEDIIVRAKEFAALHGDAYVNVGEEERKRALIDYALPKNVDGLRADLEKYRIRFDVWFRESTLHRDGTVAMVIDLLGQKGHTYEKDGAVWYRATDFGAEKDEVLVRANGIPTYFAADIAYHYNKFVTRGFDRVINVWGADHHGHVARLKGAMDAIGLDGDKLDIVLMQLVRLVRDGEPVRMSKRTGKAITLTDLLDEIPIDAARFFFNLREPKSHFDFDLDLAVKESSDNPVYYVQYAHARICSILKNLRAEGIDVDSAAQADFAQLREPDELALIRHIAKLPSEIDAAAREYDPARITRYTVDLASAYHRFYTSCRVKCAEAPLCLARTGLCLATRQVLRNCLALLKITAPETM